MPASRTAPRRPPPPSTPATSPTSWAARWTGSASPRRPDPAGRPDPGAHSRYILTWHQPRPSLLRERDISRVQEADMQEWTVETAQVIDIPGEVRSLAVRLVAGHVDVVTTDGPTGRVEVTEIDDAPVTVSIDDEGRLVIRHERLTWGGILRLVKAERRRAVVSVAVPAQCDTSIGLVTADAVVAGIHGKVDVRCVSGDIVLDEVTGTILAESVSGDVEARALAGSIALKSVSGGLTVVDGAPERVRVDNVSGDVALDLHLPSAVDITVNTVSGDLTVRLPEQAGLTVDLLSTSGHLDCAFEGLEAENKPGVRRLRGTVGDASGRLRGRTVSGSLALLARQSV